MSNAGNRQVNNHQSFEWNIYKTAVVVMLLFTSSNSIFFKLSTLPPMTFVSGRFMITSAVFLAIILIRKAFSKDRQEGISYAGDGVRCAGERISHVDERIRYTDIAILMAIGCIYATGAFVYFLALKMTALASVLFLNCCRAIFIVLLSIVILRERIGWKVYATTGITLSGILVIMLFTSSGGNHLTGNLLALLCAFCAAIYTVFMKRFAYMDVYVKLFFVFFGSFLFATVVSAIQGNPFFCDERGMGTEQLWMLCSAVLSVTIPQIIINISLRHVRATFAGNVSLMEPIVATIYGYLIWQEGVTIYHVLGGILVIGGLLLYNKVEATSIQSARSERLH